MYKHLFWWNLFNIVLLSKPCPIKTFIQVIFWVMTCQLWYNVLHISPVFISVGIFYFFCILFLTECCVLLLVLKTHETNFSLKFWFGYCDMLLRNIQLWDFWSVLNLRDNILIVVLLWKLKSSIVLRPSCDFAIFYTTQTKL